MGSIHEFCHFLPSLGWNMETGSEKVYAGKQRDAFWCGDAGQNVLAVRQMEIHLSLCMSVSECCAHTVAMLIAWH